MGHYRHELAPEVEYDECPSCYGLFLRAGELVTPFATHCLPGVTRGVVLELAHANGIPASERRVTLAELHTADEVFSTGTMGELVPVIEIDARTIGDGSCGPVTARLRSLYAACTASEREDLEL